MSKYVPKVGEVDAVQVRAGKGGLPAWLFSDRKEPRLFVLSADAGADAHPLPVQDGDWLVHHGGGKIDVLSAEQFHAKYRATRTRKAKADDE